MIFKKKYEKRYNEINICWICENKKDPFIKDKKDPNYKQKRKVKDHCHLTGKFCGAAHSACNLQCKTQK